MAIQSWKSNADLFVDVARLGYLRRDWVTLDATFGKGVFWKKWKPDHLIRMDLNPAKGLDGVVDFRDLPFPDQSIPSIVLDGPFKLNGATDPAVDERYGVDTYSRWQDRMSLIHEGIAEASRVLSEGYLLVKCQDQVCSGRVRWQTKEFTATAEDCGLGLVDRFDFLSHRKQPEGRKQVHARRNASTLLAFKRGHTS